MVCNFIINKILRHCCFPVSFSKLLRRLTLKDMSERMLERNEPKKIVFTKAIHRKVAVMASFLGQLQTGGLTVFPKRTLWCFSMKIAEFYRTSFLQNTAARLLLISCNDFNVSLALSVINQFSHSQLSRTFRKEKCFCWKIFKVNGKKQGQW